MERTSGHRTTEGIQDTQSEQMVTEGIEGVRRGRGESF
jgi:hypothetical protein